MQLQLQSECIPVEPTPEAFYGDGLPVLKHIKEKRTPGVIRDVIWKCEESAFRHEYIILSVSQEGYNGLSWLRLDRTKGLSSETGNDSPGILPAGFSVALATCEDVLSWNTDKLVRRMKFDPPCPTLVDVANIYAFMHEEVPHYTEFTFNCWWLSRELFRILVSAYMPNSQEKKQLLLCCSRRETDHCEASYYSPGRGKNARRVLLLVTLPIAPIAYPYIVGVSMITYINIFYHLRKVRKRLDERVEGYKLDVLTPVEATIM